MILMRAALMIGVAVFCFSFVAAPAVVTRVIEEQARFVEVNKSTTIFLMFLVTLSSLVYMAWFVTKELVSRALIIPMVIIQVALMTISNMALQALSMIWLGGPSERTCSTIVVVWTLLWLGIFGVRRLGVKHTDSRTV